MGRVKVAGGGVLARSLVSQICTLLSPVNRMARVGAADADRCTQRFCDGANGSPGSGGTGDSTGLRLLFGHAPSDHEETVVIMSFFISRGQWVRQGVVS